MSQKLHALVDISHNSRPSMLMLKNQQMKGYSATDGNSKAVEGSNSAYLREFSTAPLNTVDEHEEKSLQDGISPKGRHRRMEMGSMLLNIDGQEEFRNYAEWCSEKFGGLVQGWRALDGDSTW
jgi:hypothetical protein